MENRKSRSETSRPPLYLIDGSSYLYRAYFAIQTPMTTSSGLHTKAVFGITSMLLKILREKQPEYIDVIWDAKGPTFRHEIYDKYKANRPKMPEDLSEQIPYVRQVVEAMGLPQVEIEGYEADDIIASLARKCSAREVIVVSGDKDMLQLLNGNIRIWDPMKDEIVDGSLFRERYGIEPEQWRDVLALAGDSADNIPGVPGVGIKTALKLIKKYGSIENIFANLDSIKGRLKERLEENRDQIGIWTRLVTLEDSLPVEPDEKLRRREVDRETVEDLFRKLEFTRFLNELVPDRHTLSFDGYELAASIEDVKLWAEKIVSAGSVTIDTETTSEIPMKAALVGISLCITPPDAVYIPVGHVTGEKQPAMEDTLKMLAPLLADEAIKKTGQNVTT